MREIEFRGKSKESGAWVFGCYVSALTIGSFSMEISDNGATVIKNGEPHYTTDIIQQDGACESIIPETLGQFTGLLDKNGKKIYEGDIIRDTYFCRPCAIEWLGNGFWCNEDGRHSMPEPQYREIIGNIHENPELLKGGK